MSCRYVPKAYQIGGTALNLNGSRLVLWGVGEDPAVNLTESAGLVDGLQMAFPPANNQRLIYAIPAVDAPLYAVRNGSFEVSDVFTQVTLAPQGDPLLYNVYTSEFPQNGNSIIYTLAAL